MFKELGEFIDNVTRFTGRIIERALSDDDGIIGKVEPEISDDYFDQIDQMCRDGLISEEERDALKSCKSK